MTFSGIVTTIFYHHFICITLMTKVDIDMHICSFFLMKYFMKIFSYICELIKCLNDISLISICKFYYFLKYVCNSNKMDIIRC